MNILAPASGYIEKIVGVSGPTKLGDVLFQYDSNAAQLEFSKADAAITMLTATAARLESLDPNNSGPQRIASKAAVEAAEKMVAAYEDVVPERQAQFKLGLVDKLTVNQAQFVVQSAQAYLASKRLGLAQIERSFDEARALLPGLLAFLNAMRVQAQRKISLLVVKATQDGDIDIMQKAPGWIAQGTLLASYHLGTSPKPRGIVIAPASGVLDRVEFPNDAQVLPGTEIGVIDQGAEDLQLLQLDLIDRQIALAKERLGADAIAIRANALDAKITALEGQRDYESSVQAAVESRAWLGLALPVDKMLAEATYQHSLAEMLPVQTERAVLDLSVKGLQSNLGLYERLVALRRSVVSNQRQRRVVVSPIAGRTLWYVTVGSYVEVGTPLVGIV